MLRIDILSERSVTMDIRRDIYATFLRFEGGMKAFISMRNSQSKMSSGSFNGS